MSGLPAAPVVDLNSDLGEGFGIWKLGDDEALLDIVTSANVACGFHAGDFRVMEVAVAMCQIHGFASAYAFFLGGSGNLERDRRRQTVYAVVASKGMTSA